MRRALLKSKFQITPLKHVTIPRLELCAATLAVNKDAKVKKVLEFYMLPSTFWTDSEIMLAMLKGFKCLWTIE